MDTVGDDRDILPHVSTASGETVSATVSAAVSDPGDPQSTIDTIPDASPKALDAPADHGQSTGTVFWDPERTRTELAESTWASNATSHSQVSDSGQHVQTQAAANKFELLEELGRGGMGVVYKAREAPPLNRLVALKVIRDDRHDDPTNRARFKVEIEAAARLKHPNILQVFNVSELDGRPCVALELLEGGTLAKRLAGTPQPVREAAALVATLARAIHAAHSADIVHRDLKPSNVLFDHEGVPKIADFGLAKRLEVDEGETLPGQVIGTPSYMAPEQARGSSPEIGPSADIYSLGAILYEMLTGRPPLKGMTTQETLLLVLTEEPVPPRRLRPKIPFDLETICLKCIEKDPRKRYASAHDLADDLDRYLASETIHARRTPLWERALKLARRHPTTAVLLAVGVLATALGVGAVVRLQDQARQATARENARIATLRSDADKVLFKCQDALAKRLWNEVRVDTTALLGKIEQEPRLRDLRDRAERLADEAERGLNVEKATGDARTRYNRFLKAREETLFLDTRFGDAAPARETAGTARAGLGLFGKATTGDDWTLDVPPSTLSPRERDEVTTGFYELLLVLADAIAQTPGAPPAQRAAEALRVVDRAGSIRSTTRAYHLRRAAYFKAQGDDDHARSAQAEADRLAPADAFDFFLAGRELARRNDLAAWREAIPYFEATTQREPDHFWARCLLAIAHLQTHEWYKANLGLTACLQTRPDSPYLFLYRGLANAGEGDIAQELARRHPEEAAGLSKFATTKFEAAEADYKRALDLLEGHDRPEEAKLLYALYTNRGVIRFKRNDLDPAAADLRKAIRLDDHSFFAFSTLGQVYQQQGHTDAALEQFTTAIRLRPNWAPLYRERARVLIGLKTLSPEQRAAALLDLEAAIRYESPTAPVVAADQTRQAQLLRQNGQLDDALHTLDAAVADFPRDVRAHLLRIEVLLELKRYDDLIRSCDAAIAVMTPTARLYELRGMAHDQVRKFAAAIEDYTLALEHQHDDPILLCRRGWSYLANDAARLACNDFDAALRVDPSLADALGGRGTARVSLGDHRAAVADVEKALECGGRDWRVAYTAARVYCQATTIVGASARKAGPDAVALVARYQDRAVALIREAVERIPADQRSRILRETIKPDPALQVPPIRRRLRVLGIISGD